MADVTATTVPRDPTAVLGRRFGAWIVDGLLSSGLFFLIMATTVTWTETTRSCAQVARQSAGYACFESGGTTLYAEGSQLAPAALAPLAYFLLAMVLLQGVTGATPGKFLFGVRTVRADGRPCGIGKAFVRSILWIVDGLGCGVPLVGPIAAIATKGHRRVGDMAAGTFVVAAKDKGTPVEIPGLTAPAVPVGVYAGAPAPLGAPVGAPPVPQPTPDSQWDAQRGTWVRYDQDLQAWYGLNAQTGQWYTL